MGLLDLPPELLSLVIDNVTPQGFDSFYQSCKTLYEHSKDRIEHHKELKRTYTTFRCNPGSKSPFQLFVELCQNPGIAAYVEELNLTWNFDEHGGQYTTVDLELLQSYLDGSRCVQPEHRLPRPVASEATFYWRGDSITIENAAEALLPLICPHLQKLSLRDVSQDDAPNFWPSAVMQSCEDRLGTLDGPLKCLQTVTLSNCDSDLDTLAKLSAFRPYLSIPTLKRMEGYFVDGREVWTDWDDTKHTQCNVEVVEFQESCIDAAPLHRFLVRLPQLRSFHYTHSGLYSLKGTTKAWTPSSFFKTIRISVASQLRSLSLLAGAPDAGWPTRKGCNGKNQVIDHFLDLTVLEELQVQPLWIWPLDGPRESASKKERLVFRLPPSLRYLAIQESSSPYPRSDGGHLGVAGLEANHIGSLFCLFDDFAESVRSHLPQLREVQLQSAPKSYAAGFRKALWTANKVTLSTDEKLRYDLGMEAEC